MGLRHFIQCADDALSTTEGATNGPRPLIPGRGKRSAAAFPDVVLRWWQGSRPRYPSSHRRTAHPGPSRSGSVWLGGRRLSLASYGLSVHGRSESTSEPALHGWSSHSPLPSTAWMPGEMPNSRAPWQIGWSDIAHSCKEYYELSGLSGGLRSVDLLWRRTRPVTTLSQRSRRLLGTVRLDYD